MGPSTRRPWLRLTSLAAITTTVAATTITSLTGSAIAASRPGYQQLAGSAVPFTSHSPATGAVAGASRLTIQVWLRSGRLAAAQQYATAVSTPGSKLFHRYLSPDAYTAKFGATNADFRVGSRPQPNG
jgi:subtilase family serine protease